MKMRMNFSTLWLWITALLWANTARLTATEFHFLAVGDTGTAAEQQRVVAESMARCAAASANTNPVRFITFLGDNFYEDGVTNVDDPQWKTKLEDMYDTNRLNMPFYAVLGNHDWHKGLPDVEIDYTHAHPESRWKMEAHYYSRKFWGDWPSTNTHPLLELFAIDTEAWSPEVPYVKSYTNKNLAAEQFAWLESGLTNSTAIWKIVVAHHPIYTNGKHAHDKQLVELRKILGPLFERCRVDAFLAGHDHDLERIELPGNTTLFLISGAGGNLRKKGFDDYKSFYADKAGFASITLNEKEMHGQFLDGDLKPIDVWHRKPNSVP
jgi:acid phosphatase